MQNEKKAPAFTRLTNLSSVRLGASVLEVSDEFFAPAENLLKEEEAVFIPGKYTENGKWMDGWESRRKREEGYDWCIIQLGSRGTISGFNVDTAHFLGNNPAQVSIEAADLAEGNSTEGASWTEILSLSDLAPGSDNFFETQSNQAWTHLRMCIHPDGGVARLRTYGLIEPDWQVLGKREELDLAAVLNGGLALDCSDMFFSNPHNVNRPDRPLNMGDGWETRRRRGPGHDWMVLRLGCPGILKRIELDTTNFKGNYPDTCAFDAGHFPDAGLTCPAEDSNWEEIVAKSKLEAHQTHHFDIARNDTYTHIRLRIYPDGGVARLRVIGQPKLPFQG